MNNNQRRASKVKDHLELGAEIIRCRRLSGTRAMRSEGYLFAGLLYYALFPLVILPYIAAMTTMLPFIVLGYSVEEILGLSFVVGWALLYLLLCWIIYVLPRGDHFVLHEQGLRIRAGFKRLHCPLASIQAVVVGRAPSVLEERLRKVVGALNPGNEEWMNQLDGTAITVVMNDGTIHVFKALLTGFESADLEQLFQELLRRSPQLSAKEQDSSSPAEGDVPSQCSGQ